MLAEDRRNTALLRKALNFMKIRPISQKAQDHVLRDYVVIKMLFYHREGLNFWDVAEICWDKVELG